MKKLDVNLSAPMLYNIKIISDKINELLEELKKKGMIELEVDDNDRDKEYE